MDSLIERLTKERFDLFGTGFQAGMLMEGLSSAGLGERPGVFVVSGPVPPGQQVSGRPVLPLAEYMRQRVSGERRLLLLAVHESLLPEVTGAVKRAEADAGLHDAVSALPAGGLTQRLLYGEPLERRTVPMGELLGPQPENQYWLAVRYAAVLCVSGELPEGEGIYRKALSLFSGARTAERRYGTVGALLESVKTGGFQEAYPVRITVSGRIIDGLHRIAVCFYLGLESVPCEIYPESEAYDRVLNEKTRLPEELFPEAGFTPREAAVLKGLQNALQSAGRPAGEQAAGTGLPDGARAAAAAEGSGENPAISVILPVYNVEDYMDRCLRTVTAQSFRDLEIILINDGSKDGSGARCRFWERRDRRVRLRETENRGVSPARNLGVQMARGTYLMFADPDDWLDLQMAEKLFAAAEESGADFTECDLWRYDNRSGKKIHRHLSGTMGVPWTREEHMVYGATATYKSLMRRSLWERNRIRLPECSFESPAVYSLLLGLSNKIVNVPEPLYYYRRFRENSLIETGYAGKDGRPDPRLGIDAMDFLISEYRRTGIYDRYRQVLERVVKYRLSDILAMQYHRRTEEEFSGLTAAYRAFLSQRFPARRERYLVLGGYNLNRVLLHLPLLQDPSLRFNFSSLAAVVSAFGREERGGACTAVEAAPQSRGRKEQTAPFVHKNRYREMMLNREWSGDFWKILEEVQPELLFVDFMEERFPLLRAGDRIVTESDAFLGAERGPDLEGAERLPRGSEACEAVMEDAIGRFPSLVRQVSPGTRLVVLESELSLSVGDLQNREPFPEREMLERTNRLLRGYYRLLRESAGARYPGEAAEPLEGLHPGEAAEPLKTLDPGEAAERGERTAPPAVFLETAGRDRYFTDRGYEYGAVPSHLNELLNRELAEELAGKLWG